MENKVPNELFDELIRLRQALREREKQNTGRTPVICNDDSIREMIRLMPKNALPYRWLTQTEPKQNMKSAPTRKTSVKH